MKILLLDNYDSFTYNIAHIVEKLGFECDIFRNDKIALSEVEKYDKIILSPGPGIPSEAGILCELIRQYSPTKSILGICLGEQAIGEVFGCKLINLETVFHGIESQINIVAQDYIYKDMANSLTVGRYHSWVVSSENFPSQLTITATESESGQIMSLQHNVFDVRGVQFHPESVLTPEGEQIIKNWLTK